MMNFSVHWAEPGLCYVVARADPAVARIRVQFTGEQAPADLEPAGESAALGVRFFACVVPPAAEVAGVSAWDGTGRGLEQQSTDRHRRMHERFRDRED